MSVFQESMFSNSKLIQSTVYYSLVSSVQLDQKLFASLNKGDDSFVVLDADMVQIITVPDL